MNNTNPAIGNTAAPTGVDAPQPVAFAAVTEVERELLYRAADSLMGGLVWLDTHAPDWVRADIKQTRAALATALEHRQ